MRVLLTGADGNLGRHLVTAGPDISWVKVNRQNVDQIQDLLRSGIDAVVHAASDIKSPVSQMPRNLLDSNIISTAQILEHCRDAGIRRFMFMSSCAVYGNSQVTSETSDCAPISLNGACKLVNEMVIREFCSANQIQFEIYRLFNMFGGSDRFSILYRIQQCLVQGAPFTMQNNGRSLRDFIHVGDVARILLQLLKTPPKDNCLNIGSGEATRISDIVAAAKRRFQELEIRSGQRFEAEYSRADTARLSRAIGSFEFMSVLNFIEEHWSPK